MLGMDGRTLLFGGMVVAALGLAMGLGIFAQLRGLPVHQAMKDISELIYETCKTYLFTQLKFIGMPWAFMSVVMVGYYWYFAKFPISKVALILLFSLIGIAGSCFVAWFGIRVNNFANSRTAFASLEGKGFPVYSIPLRAGMGIGRLLISVELFLMLSIMLFFPDVAGPCFMGFAIGESLGASALRIAGGIWRAGRWSRDAASAGNRASPTSSRRRAMPCATWPKPTSMRCAGLACSPGLTNGA